MGSGRDRQACSGALALVVRQRDQGQTRIDIVIAHRFSRFGSSIQVTGPAVPFGGVLDRFHVSLFLAAEVAARCSRAPAYEDSAGVIFTGDTCT